MTVWAQRIPKRMDEVLSSMLYIRMVIWEWLWFGGFCKLIGLGRCFRVLRTVSCHRTGDFALYWAGNDFALGGLGD